MSTPLQSVFKKPNITYAYLIWSAISSADDKMATVGQIYQYFIENYDFYKYLPDAHGWKRAIRKKLCIDPCFFFVLLLHPELQEEGIGVLLLIFRIKVAAAVWLS
ncbi:hypothetical protein FKM82_020022 [Ascaphus truei]